MNDRSPKWIALDGFLAGLVQHLGDRYEQVEQVDSRTVGVIDSDGRRYLLDVEAVDDTPDPLIALLDRWRAP